jgi:stage V sporulation protein K
MLINDEINKNDKSFGNARYIRNLYEKVLQTQFSRIAKMKNPSKDDYCTIVAEDF